eukprot:TRINITY_DN607_c0_g1_i1.p1 TRINITY_DN607_c0_g1~~TRINITY_DN607_c0_g1_i1.p1  ORF type:complete len:166 (-),score=34.96 TRINITY_DN607_c0_g1_i1:824-1321(-)
MSGRGKAVAQKVARAIDWDFISKVVLSEEGKRELYVLRRTYDDMMKTLETKFAQKPVPIDWNYYAARLNPNIVNLFKKSYEGLQIPEYTDTYTPEYQKKHEELVKAAEAEEKKSKSLVAMLTAELAKIREQKESLRTMTVDEYFAKNPDVKKKIDDEIATNDWSI